MALFVKLQNNYLVQRTNFIGLVFSSLKKSSNHDIIDCFTTELVEKTARKWEEKRTSAAKLLSCDTLVNNAQLFRKSIQTGIEEVKRPELCVDIRNLSIQQVDNLLCSALEVNNNKDFLHLIKQCINKRIIPSDKTFIKCLKYLSFNGDTDTIDQLGVLCEEEKSDITANFGGVGPFIAISLWRRGKLEKALEKLFNSYGCHTTTEGQEVLHATFKTISLETLTNKSEAVLVWVTRTADEIYAKYSDLFVVLCLWKDCFNSEWYSDQQAAGKLFQKYEALRPVIFKEASFFCYNYLRKHNVDAVHRLVQLLLIYDNKQACQPCLSLLFEYYYYRRDLRACGEIVKNCLELGIPLTDLQSQKLLNLLLKKPFLLMEKPTVRKFEYKF